MTGDLIERLRETCYVHKNSASSGGCYAPSELRAFADEAMEAATALATEREAREKAERAAEQARIETGEAMLVIEQQDRDLAEAKRLLTDSQALSDLRLKMLSEACAELDAYRARFLSQESNDER